MFPCVRADPCHLTVPGNAGNKMASKHRKRFNIIAICPFAYTASYYVSREGRNGTGVTASHRTYSLRTYTGRYSPYYMLVAWVRLALGYTKRRAYTAMYPPILSSVYIIPALRY